MRKALYTVLSIFLFSLASNAQLTEMPNLVTNDINGNPIDLKADYIDQGKPVLVHFMAAWNVWDEFVYDSGAFQDFYNLYGPNGFDLVGMISYEIDSSTTDMDLMGLGQQTDYDFSSVGNWPIINEDSPAWGLESFGISAMPSFAMICPSGDVTVSSGLNPQFPVTFLNQGWIYSDILILSGLIDFYETTCGFDLPDDNIQGYTTYDSDNCDLILENDMVATKVIFDNGTGSPFITYSYPGGAYEYTLPDGTYDLTYEPISPLYEICEQETQITIAGDTLEGVNAIFDPIIDCPSLQVELLPWITRPCEVPSYMYAAVCNTGPLDYNGGLFTIQMEPGAIIDTIVPMINYTYDEVTGLFSTTVDTLESFDCFYFYYIYENPCSVEAGDSLCFSTFLDLSGINAGCEIYSNGNTEACIEVIGSYDPNDKTGLTSAVGENNYIDEGTELDYLIRFQNTGTDTAFTVRIEDQLSEQFDITSVRPISASHDYSMSIAERKLTFLFEDILLVDSFKNEPLSHGFVKFSIKLRDDLAPSEEIFNQASIFFDANDPVITNNFKYMIFPIESTVEFDLKSLSVFPNPTSDFIELTTDMIGNKSVTILNVDGRKTAVNADFNSDKINININSLNPGIYFVQIHNENGEKSEVKRIVKL